MAQRYPIMLSVEGWTAVIVGGGAVAARKARGLLAAGAVVKCVAPEFCEDMPGEVERVTAAYQPSVLDDASLVFVATDRPEVNEAVVRDALWRKLLVNRADVDEDQPGNFIVPAVYCSGAVTVTVSAGSPALSALVRDRLSKAFDPHWETMAEAMKELRPAIRSANLEIGKRRLIFRDLATEQAIDIVGAQGLEGLKRWLFERHPELTHA
ncbi:MAG TPA: bifunctional precorrin-2 dehydrogenase/sirohydrochlorin ferrochelatase [Tepidisphaeraceae bacterium]